MCARLRVTAFHSWGKFNYLQWCQMHGVVYIQRQAPHTTLIGCCALPWYIGTVLIQFKKVKLSCIQGTNKSWYLKKENSNSTPSLKRFGANTCTLSLSYWWRKEVPNDLMCWSQQYGGPEALLAYAEWLIFRGSELFKLTHLHMVYSELNWSPALSFICCRFSDICVEGKRGHYSPWTDRSWLRSHNTDH